MILGAADYVASLFTPFIVCIAVIAFIVWFCLAAYELVPTEGITPVVFALRFGLAVLVVSCPCAIALAVPSAILVATSSGARHGVLFKGGDSVEGLGKSQDFIFDKTGTLTQGRFAVDSTLLFNNFLSDERSLLYYFAGIESASEHPLGRAITKRATDLNIPITKDVSKVVTEAGKGFVRLNYRFSLYSYIFLFFFF